MPIFTYRNLVSKNRELCKIVRDAENGIFNDGEIESDEEQVIYDGLKTLFNFYVIRSILTKKLERNKSISATDISNFLNAQLRLTLNSIDCSLGVAKELYGDDHDKYKKIEKEAEIKTNEIAKRIENERI